MPHAARPTAHRCLAQRQPRRRGLSMVESLCALVIALLLLSSALPMFDALRSTQSLQSAASLLETDIHYGRSTAISLGVSVRLVVQALPDGGSCYLMHTGPAGSCSCGETGAAVCSADGRLLRVETQRATAGITLVPLARPVLFDGHKGTVTPTATLQLLARDGRAIHQVVNIMGRVRSCTPTGPLPGIRACA